MGAWQAERAAEREQEQLDRDLADGRISDQEHREATRDIERGLQDAYEQDREAALAAVNDDWGIW